MKKIMENIMKKHYILSKNIRKYMFYISCIFNYSVHNIKKTIVKLNHMIYMFF